MPSLKEMAAEGAHQALEAKRHYDNYMYEVDKGLSRVSGVDVNPSSSTFEDITKGVALAASVYNFETLLHSLTSSSRVAILSIEKTFDKSHFDMPDVFAYFDPMDVNDKTVWVVCRGTATIRDMVGDLKWLADIVPFANLHVPQIPAERAVASCSLLHPFLADLAREFGPQGPTRVAFCGHSLGGAVAGTMCMKYVMDTGGSMLDYICVTLAAPHYLPNDPSRNVSLPEMLQWDRSTRQVLLSSFTDKTHNVVQRFDLIPRMVGPHQLPPALLEACKHIGIDELLESMKVRRDRFEVVGRNYMLNPAHKGRPRTIFKQVHDPVALLASFPTDMTYFALALAQDHNSDTSKDALRGLCLGNEGNFQMLEQGRHLPWIDIYPYRPGSGGVVVASKGKPPSAFASDSDVVIEHKAGEVQSDDLLVFSAFCCSINSCYCKMPECCGCYISSVCCCFKSEMMACKPSNVKGECCILSQGSYLCISPTTCCKGTDQCCCLDTRCAFPCDHDVPCVVALCFCVCCVNFAPKCGCFQKLGSYTKVKQAAAPKYQEQQSTSRRSSSSKSLPASPTPQVAYAQPYPSQGYAQTNETYPQQGPKSAPYYPSAPPSHDPYAEQVNPMARRPSGGGQGSGPGLSAGQGYGHGGSPGGGPRGSGSSAAYGQSQGQSQGQGQYRSYEDDGYGARPSMEGRRSTNSGRVQAVPGSVKPGALRVSKGQRK